MSVQSHIKVIDHTRADVVLRAMNNEYRLRILSICRTKTLQSSLEHLLKIRASTISNHVQILVTAGLVTIIEEHKDRKKRYVKTIYDTVQINILSPSAAE